MKPMKQVFLLAALALSLAIPAAALDITASPTEQFCFSAEDFTTQSGDEGIFVVAVPSSNIASIRYCGRDLRAGDALPKEVLNQLTLSSQCVTEQTTAVTYYTISDGKVTGLKSMELSIRPKKNDPPTAQDAALETYRNIANSGQLQASDPDGDALTFSVETPPKRGTVELNDDGSFTYTPLENKVGKDRFTFTVCDEAGNVSEPATVTIRIKKPSEKATYADMEQDPDAFVATWLREKGIFTGSSIGGHLCFSPEASVSRGEFLVLVMNLVQAQADTSAMSTGFADESDTPTWLQPYLVSALRNGMISGVTKEDGVVFLAQEPMTQAEAAVMVQNILKLPLDSAASVFSQEQADCIPTWAADAAAALTQAGIDFEISSETQPLTRRSAARLLYDIQCLMDTEAISTFYWSA